MLRSAVPRSSYATDYAPPLSVSLPRALRKAAPPCATLALEVQLAPFTAAAAKVSFAAPTMNGGDVGFRPPSFNRASEAHSASEPITAYWEAAREVRGDAGAAAAAARDKQTRRG